MPIFALFLSLLGLPSLSFAAEHHQILDLTGHWVGATALGIFILAYLLVMAEEYIDLKKSKPVVIAAGVIWALVAWYYQMQDIQHVVEENFRHTLLEFAELMLFLLVAMTYISAMEERRIFEALRSWLVRKGFSYRSLFWVTGLLAFFISPIADNLTTALLMGAVVLAVGGSNKNFVLLACINLVVAANAGGAFSPFGDITTLMVWQKNVHASNGVVSFWTFFNLLIPSLVNWLVPATVMSFFIPNEKPEGNSEKVTVLRGGFAMIFLFLITISLAVSSHNFLHMPPVLGMLTGLGLLKLLAFLLRRVGEQDYYIKHPVSGEASSYDIFGRISQAEWDTLFFFYGVILSVGGLGLIGYMSMMSSVMYGEWGPTVANIAVGGFSAIVDNIPVMFAVLTMLPDMSVGQWLLATLTAGVGGSMLSIGSAAGVALMGQAHGKYTFFGHLKWTPVIALGYVASIWTHFMINSHLFG